MPRDSIYRPLKGPSFSLSWEHLAQEDRLRGLFAPCVAKSLQLLEEEPAGVIRGALWQGVGAVAEEEA